MQDADEGFRIDGQFMRQADFSRGNPFVQPRGDPLGGQLPFDAEPQFGLAAAC